MEHKYSVRNAILVTQRCILQENILLECVAQVVDGNCFSENGPNSEKKCLPSKFLYAQIVEKLSYSEMKKLSNVYYRIHESSYSFDSYNFSTFLIFQTIGSLKPRNPIWRHHKEMEALPEAFL